MRAAQVVVAAVAAVLVIAVPSSAATGDDVAAALGSRPLSGVGNNAAHPTWGAAGVPYARVAPADYGDGIGSETTGPPARYVSNRIFNDEAQNLFSENGVTQWGFVWGQFLDHTFGLRQETGGENAPIAFNTSDPFEEYGNDLGSIAFSRTPAAPGTGTAGVPRQQINTLPSYIDAFAVYGGSDARLEWLRAGPVDGDLSNNSAKLLLDPGGMLPRVTSRGDASTAPVMALDGRLLGEPQQAMVAGDQRANENVALTAIQTLFAREHNRIVDALPAGLSEELKFQIARRVVSAEQQYITYTEFLPALGIRLPAYRSYDPTVNATLSNEFATVGYRAHSMIHGEIEPAGEWSAAQLQAFRDQGISVTDEGDETELGIPLNLTFDNPDLLASVGVGPVLEALGNESEYRNDELIDNQLRSVLFQVPKPGSTASCLDGVSLPDCFTGVVDLGAIDLERGRDHGMPHYNDLRRAYGLAPKASFTDITGESTDAGDTSTLGSLDFLSLRDIAGRPLPLGDQVNAVSGVRRTTLAARLKAVYGSVDAIDAFTGMVSEQHVPGTDFGELQLAMWTKQFQALRDGDRFFYLNDPALALIGQDYGISAQRSLAQVIRDNTGEAVRDDVFKLPGAPSTLGGTVGATVAPMLSLTLGAPASFGGFTPGVARVYTASSTATVTSTAGDAALTVGDPGHLRNGSSVMPQALGVGPLPSWNGPATNNTVALSFTQPVAATDALRTGTYSTTLTFTLSTTSP